MNGITLTTAGNLTRDPDFSTVGSDRSLAKFSIACKRSWRNNSTNEWEESISYLDVICWGTVADDAARLLSKGTRVIVSGRIDQQNWEDKDTGAKRSRLELTADEIAVSLRAIDSFERKTYEANDTGRQPVGAGARNGASRPQPARRSAPADTGDIWDN